MKKMFYCGVSLLLTVSAVMSSCSDSDDAQKGLNRSTFQGQEPLWSEANHDFGELNTTAYKTDDGTTWLWHDNFDRLTTIMLFIPAEMNISVLYQCPSSIEQFNGRYYRLGSDNELRLYDSQEFQAEANNTNTSGMATGFELYNQYYKGLRVAGKGYTVNYYVTPQGKRLAYALGQVLTDLSVDTHADVDADAAKQTFAARLGEDVTRDWEAELMVREFIIKQDGQNVRDERLIWHVKGTAYPEEEAERIMMYSSRVNDGPLRHEAEIDAHTGRLLVEGHSLSGIF